MTACFVCRAGCFIAQMPDGVIGRMIVASLTGFAAGYLLVERAEQLIRQKVLARHVFCPENDENLKLKAILMFTFGTAMLLSIRCPEKLLLRNWLFYCLLFISAFVDHFIYLIPNEEIFLGLFLWGLWELIMDKPFRLILLKFGTAVFFAFCILLVTFLLEAWKKRRMFGRGDIKLLFVCVLFLGIENALYVIAMACICCLLRQTLRGNRKMHAAIPFGPCIAFAVFFALFFYKNPSKILLKFVDTLVL